MQVQILGLRHEMKKLKNLEDAIIRAQLKTAEFPAGNALAATNLLSEIVENFSNLKKEFGKKTHPEALKILVALAQDARFHLHYCNIFLRKLNELDKYPLVKYLMGYNSLQANYLQEQNLLVSALNALGTAKEAVGRK